MGYLGDSTIECCKILMKGLGVLGRLRDFEWRVDLKFLDNAYFRISFVRLHLKQKQKTKV